MRLSAHPARNVNGLGLIPHDSKTLENKGFYGVCPRRILLANSAMRVDFPTRRLPRHVISDGTRLFQSDFIDSKRSSRPKKSFISNSYMICFWRNYIIYCQFAQYAIGHGFTKNTKPCPYSGRENRQFFIREVAYYSRFAYETCGLWSTKV